MPVLPIVGEAEAAVSEFEPACLVQHLIDIDKFTKQVTKMQCGMVGESCVCNGYEADAPADKRCFESVCAGADKTAPRNAESRFSESPSRRPRFADCDNCRKGGGDRQAGWRLRRVTSWVSSARECSGSVGAFKRHEL
jgi:hypothetical protein